jgi:hypothetical protein
MTPTPCRAAVLASVDADQAAALDRLRAAFGPVEVLAVCAPDPDPDAGPERAPGLVQGCLLDQDTAG